MNDTNMQRRKEIHREYKERVKPSGVFQIKKHGERQSVAGKQFEPGRIVEQASIYVKDQRAS